MKEIQRIGVAIFALLLMTGQTYASSFKMYLKNDNTKTCAQWWATWILGEGHVLWDLDIYTGDTAIRDILLEKIKKAYEHNTTWFGDEYLRNMSYSRKITYVTNGWKKISLWVFDRWYRTIDPSREWYRNTKDGLAKYTSDYRQRGYINWHINGLDGKKGMIGTDESCAKLSMEQGNCAMYIYGMTRKGNRIYAYADKRELIGYWYEICLEEL